MAPLFAVLGCGDVEESAPPHQVGYEGTMNWGPEVVPPASCEALPSRVEASGHYILSQKADALSVYEEGVGCTVELTKVADKSYSGTDVSCTFPSSGSWQGAPAIGTEQRRFKEIALDFTAATASYLAIVETKMPDGVVLERCIRAEFTLSNLP